MTEQLEPIVIKNDSFRLFIMAAGLLIVLLASVGGVYLQAQSYTDKRIEERRTAVQAQLLEIKQAQKNMQDILWEIDRKLERLQIILKKQGDRTAH